MTKLTEKELEQECIKFNKYLLAPFPLGIHDYKSNEFVSKTLEMNVDFISSALLAWLKQAELAKDEVNEKIRLENT